MAVAEMGGIAAESGVTSAPSGGWGKGRPSRRNAAKRHSENTRSTRFQPPISPSVSPPMIIHSSASGHCARSASSVSTVYVFPGRSVSISETSNSSCAASLTIAKRSWRSASPRDLCGGEPSGISKTLSSPSASRAARAMARWPR